MQKFFTLLFSMCLCVVFAGCPAECEKIKPATDAVAMSFAQTLDCKGTDAMKADFLKFAERNGMCTEQLEGPIANMICPILARYVVGFGVGKLPTTWQCSGQPAEAALAAACKMLPY